MSATDVVHWIPGCRSPTVAKTSLMIPLTPFKQTEAHQTYRIPVTSSQRDPYRKAEHPLARSQTHPYDRDGKPRHRYSNKATSTNHSSRPSTTHIASGSTTETTHHKSDLQNHVQGKATRTQQPLHPHSSSAMTRSKTTSSQPGNHERPYIPT